MKFLSAVLLSLGTARASFVVDLSHNTADAPSDGPMANSFASDEPSAFFPSTFPISVAPSGESPSSADLVPSEAPGGESEYPLSEAPFFTTSTFDPKEQGNCNRPEIDTFGYTKWKMEKSFGEENCSHDYSNPFTCSLEIDGFKASAEFTYKENPLQNALNPVVDSLVVYDELTNVGISGYYYVDFFGDCIDSVIVTLESIEFYRENPDQVPQAPSDRPMANSFASDEPSAFFPSTFPISVAPSGESSSSFFPHSEVPSGPAMTSIAPDPTAAPSIDCTDIAGEFEYEKKKKTKTISCDKIAGFPHKKRNRFCRKEKTIRQNCPTLCNRKICPCIDVDVPFPLSKRMRNDMAFWTCEKLADLKKKKQKRLCKNKRVIRKSCPSICDKTCTASEQ